MATVTITIPTPVLTPPDYFRVRYRKLPSDPFQEISDQTNVPFTITDLSEGDYELEVTPVIGGVDCPITLTTFTVSSAKPCLNVTDGFIQLAAPGSGMSNVATVVYDAPPNPPCGWIVEWGSELDFAYGAQSVSYYTASDFPPSPLLLPSSTTLGTSQKVRIIADYCGGDQIVCYDAIIQRTESATCTGFLNVEAQIVAISGTYKIQFDILQSVPATTAPLITFTQGNLVEGDTPDSGSVTASITPSTTVFFIDLNPFINMIRPRDLYYVVQIRDICGNEYTFNLDYSVLL